MAVFAALSACLVPAVATTAAPPAKGAAPRLYWGAWIGDQLTGTAPPWDMRGVKRLERLVGKGMSLVEFSSPFAECNGGSCSDFQFPTSQMQAIRAHGSIPVFSWGSEIIPRESVAQPEINLRSVASGRYDSYIREFAAKAKAWGHPFFLRFDWEMNGNWFPWGEGVNGNGAGQYVAAWRHVHDIFSEVGATNVTWVWCPYADEQHRSSNIRRAYPGSSYVDWTCMDGYNWGSSRGKHQRWKSFDELFRATYSQLTRKVAPGKPVMLGEFASNSRGGDKGAWIREMFAQLPRAFPDIRALIWFDTVDRGLDWPIETSPRAVKAFRAGVAPDRYLGNVFAGLAQEPIPAPR